MTLNFSRILRALCALSVLCVNSCIFISTAISQTPPRPKITGIISVRLYSSDLHASRAFYSKILGFDSATSTCLGMKNPCYAVNGRQRVELQQIAGGAPDNLLAEIAFATPNLSQMREFLLAHKIEAGPITKDETGTLRFAFKDPEGHPLAFVQSGDRFSRPRPIKSARASFTPASSSKIWTRNPPSMKNFSASVYIGRAALRMTASTGMKFRFPMARSGSNSC